MFAGHAPGADDEEHKKKFEAARKAHYNMRDLLAHKTVRLAEGTGTDSPSSCRLHNHGATMKSIGHSVSAFKPTISDLKPGTLLLLQSFGDDDDDKPANGNGK